MADKKRERKTFKHPNTGHVTATSVPAEQVRLRGQGYVEQKPAPKPAVPAKPADGGAKK